MADNNEEVAMDDENLLRKLLETIARGRGDGSSTSENLPDNVAQFIAVALNQLSQETSPVECEVEINNVDNTVEVPSSSSAPPSTTSSNTSAAVQERQKNIGIKFSPEVRRTIVNYRKGGKRYRDIARELGASVSGVQKVWERFLSTGTIGDKKPSPTIGRPRKFGKSGDLEPSLSVTEEEGEEEELIETGCSSLPAVLITGDNHTEEPMDVPGATVEVVATTTSTNSVAVSEKKNTSSRRKVATPTYREELLLKLVRDCPLARMREDSAQTTNQHVLNLLSSIHQPLYMEYVLGHPFGRVPSPKPFQRNEEESQIILSDKADPLGKEILSVLGYTTKVYFNACCIPSPLFDEAMVLTCLPLSIGPGYIADTMQELVQLLLNLCRDPLDAVKLIPDEVSGVEVHVVSPIGEGVVTKCFSPPTKLSGYWSDVYYYGSLFKCCENFLSATPPSSPCLLCHSFESFAENLEIMDGEATPTTLSKQDDQFVPLATSETVTVVTEDHPSPDGIHYVAYSGTQNVAEEATPIMTRRSSRKRGGSSDNVNSEESSHRLKRVCDN